MSKENTPIGTVEEEYDELLPEGWSGNDDADIFDPATWGMTDTAADAQEDGSDQDAGNSAEEDDDQTRATEEDADSQTGPDEDEEVPATDDSVDDGKLHFTATVDHVQRDVELDPAELPAIYEKSTAVDRYKARISTLEAELKKWDSLASGLKYENRDALRIGLFEAQVQDFIAEHPSVPEEMARDYITRQLGADQAQPATQEPEPAPDQAQSRDFKQEVSDLFSAFPDARFETIPDEVTNEAVSRNVPLVQAYANWKAKTASATASRVQRENKILKQNQAAAARAPVSKVTGGGKTDTRPVDDFLRGFEDDSAW